MEKFLQISFRLHDVLSDFVQVHFKGISKVLLIVAHFSLFGIFFPSILKLLGDFSLTLLMSLLVLSPVSKILRMRFLYQLMGLRRELGIWTAYVAIVHGGGYFLDPVFLTYVTTISPDMMQGRLIFGFFGLALLTILLMTSNNFSQRHLKRAWKKVHWLVYPAFAFALAHKTFSGRVTVMQDWSGFLNFLFVFGGYVWLKYMARKGVPEYVQRGIDFVAQRYRAHRETLQTVVL